MFLLILPEGMSQTNEWCNYCWVGRVLDWEELFWRKCRYYCICMHFYCIVIKIMRSGAADILRPALCFFAALEISMIVQCQFCGKIFQVEFLSRSCQCPLELQGIVCQRSRYKPGMFLGAIAKLRKATDSCPPAHPYGTTRLPLNGFSWTLIFEYFSKNSRKFKFH